LDGLLVRAVYPKEADQVAPLLLELARQESAGLALSPKALEWLTLEVREEMKRFYSENGWSLYILALSGEREVVGVVHFSVMEAPCPFVGRIAAISRLYVKPEARGQGVAPALIRAVREMGAQAQCKYAQLFVSNEHKTPERLYRRMGFKPVGTALVKKVG
jgi:ribosomal protein S18 acetylase RimI-like enzyme